MSKEEGSKTKEQTNSHNVFTVEDILWTELTHRQAVP